MLPYFSKTQRFGNKGEHWAYNQLKKMGYEVTMPTDYHDDKDLLISGLLPVEVKSSNQKEKKRYSHKRGFYSDLAFSWNGIKAHKHKVILLLCKSDVGFMPFIVPGRELENVGYFQITSFPTSYSGRLSDYLWNWQVIDQHLARLQRLTNTELPLFAGMGVS